MNNLRRLVMSATLLCLLAMPAFADGNDTCIPGSTTSPPCVAAQVTDDESIVPGSTNSPPALSSETEYSIAEATVDLLMNVLFLF